MMCATPGCVRPHGHDPPCIDGMMETILGKLNVEVLNFSGCRLHISMDQDSDVASLKHILHDRWQVPPSYQTILVVGRVLNDVDLLKHHCSPDSMELTISMLLSLDGLQVDLRSPECATREHALDFLIRHGSKGHIHSVDEVMGFVGQANRHVTFFCARVLLAFAQRGHTQLSDNIDNPIANEQDDSSTKLQQVCGRKPHFTNAKDLIMQAQTSDTFIAVMASVLDGTLPMLEASLTELLGHSLNHNQIFSDRVRQEAVKALANVVLDQLHMPLTETECESRRSSLRRVSSK